MRSFRAVALGASLIALLPLGFRAPERTIEVQSEPSLDKKEVDSLEAQQQLDVAVHCVSWPWKQCVLWGTRLFLLGYVGIESSIGTWLSSCAHWTHLQDTAAKKSVRTTVYMHLLCT